MKFFRPGVDIGGTPINVRKRASAVFEEEDLAVVPLRLGSFAVEMGSSWDVRPQKNFWEEERGEITGSCELCGSVEGLWRKLLAFLMQQPGILFHLKIWEQVLKGTRGLSVWSSPLCLCPLENTTERKLFL